MTGHVHASSGFGEGTGASGDAGQGHFSSSDTHAHGAQQQGSVDAAGTGAATGVRPGPRGRARWVEEGGLEVGVRPGTYNLVFRDGSAACGWVVRSHAESALLARRRREGAVRRRAKLVGGLDGLLTLPEA